ncbi:MAG: hypothetical protein BWZ10_02715 [candidate division BRC1 bacterium ADurb.BinA364]|nr:MAG: hypothetical protein BWZ10_02715 [candidate division BRC1 bacterium ADurb.BinA364]
MRNQALFVKQLRLLDLVFAQFGQRTGGFQALPRGLDDFGTLAFFHQFQMRVGFLALRLGGMDFLDDPRFLGRDLGLGAFQPSRGGVHSGLRQFDFRGDFVFEHLAAGFGLVQRDLAHRFQLFGGAQHLLRLRIIQPSQFLSLAHRIANLHGQAFQICVDIERQLVQSAIYRCAHGANVIQTPIDIAADRRRRQHKANQPDRIHVALPGFGLHLEFGAPGLAAYVVVQRFDSIVCHCSPFPYFLEPPILKKKRRRFASPKAGCSAPPGHPTLRCRLCSPPSFGAC